MNGIEKAIQHCKEVALKTECVECRNDHLELADWLEELIQLRKEKQQNRWIPVSERLPSQYGKYLCCTKNGSIILAKYYGFGSGNKWSTFGSVAKAIVAWQPLPERYGEVEK